jgi:hypothetical protein
MTKDWMRLCDSVGHKQTHLKALTRKLVNYESVWLRFIQEKQTRQESSQGFPKV